MAEVLAGRPKIAAIADAGVNATDCMPDDRTMRARPRERLEIGSSRSQHPRERL
jgi:hypothetical protein